MLLPHGTYHLRWNTSNKLSDPLICWRLVLLTPEGKEGRETLCSKVEFWSVLPSTVLSQVDGVLKGNIQAIGTPIMDSVTRKVEF